MVDPVGCGVVLRDCGLDVAFNASTSAVTEIKLPLRVRTSVLIAFIASVNCASCAMIAVLSFGGGFAWSLRFVWPLVFPAMAMVFRQAYQKDRCRRCVKRYSMTRVYERTGLERCTIRCLVQALRVTEWWIHWISFSRNRCCCHLSRNGI